MSIEERREAVKNLTDEGHSVREIAGIIGVSHGTVGNDVQKLTPPEPLDAVAALAASNPATTTLEAPAPIGGPPGEVPGPRGPWAPGANVVVRSPGADVEVMSPQRRLPQHQPAAEMSSAKPAT